MAYNELLAERVRGRLAVVENVEEKKMMGGLVFMVNDKMCVGIIKDELMCRIDPSIHEMAVEKHGCRTMDFSKRPMMGYVLIEEIAMRSKSDFDYWIGLSLEFNKIAKSSTEKKKVAGKK
jgi:TfoX/Sxy family transcriptional regulator of competence genes